MFLGRHKERKFPKDEKPGLVLVHLSSESREVEQVPTRVFLSQQHLSGTGGMNQTLI